MKGQSMIIDTKVNDKKETNECKDATEACDDKNSPQIPSTPPNSLAEPQNNRKCRNDNNTLSPVYRQLIEMGFDHEKLTFRHAGRDFRLTDVHGHVVDDIIA